MFDRVLPCNELSIAGVLLLLVMFSYPRLPKCEWKIGARFFLRRLGKKGQNKPVRYRFFANHEPAVCLP
jgi:hypothetical protein